MNNPMGRTVGIFDGVSTESFGVKLINMDSGIQTDPFLPQQEFVQDETFYRDNPYHYGTKKRTLEIVVTFFKEGYWDQGLKSKFAEMIDPRNGNFVEFFTEQDPDKRYFVKYLDAVDFHNAGDQGGYFSVRFRANSPYTYSREYEVDYDFSSTATNQFYLANNGVLDLEPEMWIDKIGNGSIEIINNTTGVTMLIENLENTEELYVDNENGDIISSLEVNNVYRYDSHNGNYLVFAPGTNDITIKGRCMFRLKYRFMIKG